MSIPRGAHQDVEKWLTNPRDSADFRAKLTKVKEEAMKKKEQEQKTANVVHIKHAGYEVDDPIAFYQKWEQEANQAAWEQQEKKRKREKNPLRLRG